MWGLGFSFVLQTDIPCSGTDYVTDVLCPTRALTPAVVGPKDLSVLVWGQVRTSQSGLDLCHPRQGPRVSPSASVTRSDYVMGPPSWSVLEWIFAVPRHPPLPCHLHSRSLLCRPLCRRGPDLFPTFLPPSPVLGWSPTETWGLPVPSCPLPGFSSLDSGRLGRPPSPILSPSKRRSTPTRTGSVSSGR